MYWLSAHFLTLLFCYLKCCILGVSGVKLPSCTKVSEGHTISLTVKCDLDAELDNKVKNLSCLNLVNGSTKYTL